MICVVLAAGAASAAPYAAMVIDARSGEVLHSRNADTRLHPASLTKMMTLYVVFDAVERGEISLDTPVRVSRNAASKPPSKLYLKEGQRIQLRYLIRASAVKSANDAAAALAEAISGSEAAFAERMTRTARALGMNDTTFKNAHGLTQSGHLSTARDMTTLGRALFFHFPDYYHLFSRRSAEAAGKTVYNTNRKLLAAYKGADGIKTGYTRAAGFNLVASAERGNKRIIATMFGGSSGAARNARVAELLDMGFQRAPTRVAMNPPSRPNLTMIARGNPVRSGGSLQLAVASSDRPVPRPVRAEAVIAAVAASVSEKLGAQTDGQSAGVAASTAALSTDAIVAQALLPDAAAQAVPDALPEGVAGDAATAPADTGGTGAPGAGVELASAAAASAPGIAAATATATAFATPVSPAPPPRPAVITFSSKGGSGPEIMPEQRPETVVVAQVSTSDGGNWGISVGTYASRYEAERILLRTALIEIDTLDTALRKVVHSQRGFSAQFTGMDERSAALACQRLSARQQRCETVGP
ncbi:D-alanyl-D-alanine carboxypeptidase family protein [Meridianimarinicoccus roseus]|nr:D-alanyl-D-alanine carboxypeptidase family protein [Meridianimarinicoccus roseus]